MRLLLFRSSEEAVLLQPYPEKWNDLVTLRGECFNCGNVQRVSSFPPFRQGLRSLLC